MQRRMRKLIGLRLADPAFAVLEELAIDDDRKITQMARRLLLERLAQIVAERQRPGANSNAGTSTGAAA
jgi:hypothetical protein